MPDIKAWQIVMIAVLAAAVRCVRILFVSDFDLKKYANASYVCRHCGHRFKRKARRVMSLLFPGRVRRLTFTDTKTAFAKCPACRVRDRCNVAFEEYYE